MLFFVGVLLRLFWLIFLIVCGVGKGVIRVLIFFVMFLGVFVLVIVEGI